MPIYEYECQTCHRHTEKRQKFSDPEITACPHCGGPLQRVISAPAFSFAGGGWYKDLYSSAKPPAASGGEGKADSGPGAEAKSGSKGSESGGKSSESGGKGGESGAKDSPSTPAPAAAPATSSSSSEKK